MGHFPTDYVPTVLDNYSENMLVDGKDIQLCLWDPHSGRDSYERLRPLSYPCTEIFLLCFSVVSRESMQNIISKWIPEISHHVPQASYMIIATQTDLRNDPSIMAKGMHCVTEEEGLAMAVENGAEHYMECSALTDEQTDINYIFEEAVRFALLNRGTYSFEFNTILKLEYTMLSKMENNKLLRNRKYFYWFNIYDVNTAVFNLFCLFFYVYYNNIYL
eukprot:554160_1